MEHKRQRVQFGWVCLKARKKGPDVWVLRYRENVSDGVTTRRSAIIGNVKEFPNESQARKAALSWLFSMNAEASSGAPVSFGAVIRRYLVEELPERISTASRYRCWLKNHVEPKWRDYPIEQIKPLLVEDWLKKLDLAPKSKSHLKNLMRVLFNASMRWELIPYQHNPMSLVRVKDGSKRQRQPKALSVEEFRKLLEHVPEPFRTMCIVAMCLGLRVSEILGLKWKDIDWEGLRLAVRQAYVYGQEGELKTQASQRWMPLDRLLAEKLREHKRKFASFAIRRDGFSRTRKRDGRIGQAEFKKTGLSRQHKRRGWAGLAGTRSDTAFNVASCAWSRSQGAAGTLAACGYSNDHEYLHPGHSYCIARGEQQVVRLVLPAQVA